MKRLLLMFALLPQCTGCLCYAYPTISTTPELVAPTPDGSVHAFRVDVDRTERKSGPTATEYTLMRIPMGARGVIPSQLEVAHATGIWNPLVGDDDNKHVRSQYTMLVRLYRPGYVTQEVKAWDKSRHIDWAEARDVPAQEKAIDDLLRVPGSVTEPSIIGTMRSSAVMAAPTWWDLKDQKSPPLGLQPGMVAPGQRLTLMFAASEYERLINAPGTASPTMQPVRDRLRAKTNWLRAFAEQAATR